MSEKDDPVVREAEPRPYLVGRRHACGDGRRPT
jgi:hypothetical protein